jgi:hypothetical protein
MNTARDHRPSTAARRFGYSVSGAINLVLLYLINRNPGWAAVPFLTDRAADVIPLVNASLIIGLTVSLVQVVHDPRWLVALGRIATTVIGMAVMVRTWQVFPFDFGDASFNWPLVTRFVLAVGVLGSVVGLIAHTVSLAGSLAEAGLGTARHRHH